VYKSRGSYEPSAKFTTWLYRIATHLALNAIRDGKKEKGQQSLDQQLPDGRERQVADSTHTVEEAMVARIRVQEIRAAIETLPEKQRAAVLMHKYQGLGYAQISKALDCSESATKSLLFRAYETLRSRLAHMV
jgi:RNA polymerase sigma-70 factor (ECF subfamily)